MAKKISEKTLKKSFRTWFFWNGCSQQAESMLGMAFGQAMAPVIDELYDTKEEKAAALQRHITLFNTEAQVGSICNGIVCGLEEANANGHCTPELISSVKVAFPVGCHDHSDSVNDLSVNLPSFRQYALAGTGDLHAYLSDRHRGTELVFIQAGL